jgi:hypothetical protein
VVIVGGPKIGIKLDRFGEVRDRAVIVAFQGFDNAATPVDSRIIRLEFDGFGEVCDRAVKVALGVLRSATTYVGSRIIRPEFNGFTKTLACSVPSKGG